MDEGRMLHPVPCTLYPAPCTLHPAPCTLHPVPWTLYPVPCTLFSELDLSAQLHDAIGRDPEVLRG